MPVDQYGLIPEGLGAGSYNLNTLTIGGVDVTAMIDITTLKITSALSDRVDELDVDVVDSALSLAIANEQEVICTDASGNRLFGGWVAGIQRDYEGRTRRWAVKAREYGIILDQRRINRIYESTADNTAIADFMSAYVPEISTGGVTFIANLDKKQFARHTAREALQAIADYTGGEFYVDYLKVLHYFAPGAVTAPYALSDVPDYAASYPYHNWTYEVDSSQLKNRVIVLGGVYEAAPLTEVFTGDGATTVFTTAHPKPAPQSVTVAGANVVVGMVSVNHYADGYGVLVDDVKKTWTFAVAPAAGAAIDLTYRYQAPVQVQVVSYGSYAQYGRYYDGFINDSGLLSQQAALDRGQTELAEYAFAREIAKCRVTQPGLRAGQVVSVTSALDSLSAHPMLVQKVTTKGLGGGLFEYELELGNYNPDLLMQVLGIAQTTQRTTMAQDFLQEFANLTDGMTMAENPVATAHTGAYTYGDGLAKWGLATWG